MPNKKRRCTSCKKYKEADKGIVAPIGFFCDKNCRYDYATKQTKTLISKSKKIEIKKKNKEHKAKKEAIKPKSKFLAEAQAAFNKYIRLRDYEQPCISCLKPKEVIEAEQGWKVGGCWDAGHFMTRGAKGQLRFVLFNVHKQCKSCNGGGGRFSAKAATVDANYRINLIEKIGVDKVELLENNNDIDLKKGDIEYLKRIKRIFNKRALRLQKRIARR